MLLLQNISQKSTQLYLLLLGPNVNQGVSPHIKHSYKLITSYLYTFLVILRHSTLGRSSVAGPAHKFPGFGATVIYYI